MVSQQYVGLNCKTLWECSNYCGFMFLLEHVSWWFPVQRFHQSLFWLRLCSGWKWIHQTYIYSNNLSQANQWEDGSVLKFQDQRVRLHSFFFVFVRRCHGRYPNFFSDRFKIPGSPLVRIERQAIHRDMLENETTLPRGTWTRVWVYWTMLDLACRTFEAMKRGQKCLISRLSFVSFGPTGRPKQVHQITGIRGQLQAGNKQS